jgi:hypothetical protein
LTRKLQCLLCVSSCAASKNTSNLVKVLNFDKGEEIKILMMSDFV